MSAPTERPVNTWQQLAAAGGGVMITRPGNPGRNAGTSAWAVIRVTAEGREVLTEPDCKAWYRHGRRWFHDMTLGGRDASLAAAQAWVAERSARATLDTRRLTVIRFTPCGRAPTRRRMTTRTPSPRPAA